MKRGKFTQRLDAPRPEPLFTVPKPSREDQYYGSQHEQPGPPIVPALIVISLMVSAGMVIVKLINWLS